MKKYRHLSLEEREKLYFLKGKGYSFREIAKVLGRSDTTLCREWKRNKTGPSERANEYLIFKYVPCFAQGKADKRALKQRTKAPLKEPLIFLYTREHLREPHSWSPEEISGRISIDHPGYSVTTETIYQYIYGKGRRYKLWKHLVLSRKKRMKKGGRRIRRDGKISGSVSIDLRPQVVGDRTRIGDWETDNVIGKQIDRTALSVTVERVTRVAFLTKLKDRSAQAKTNALADRLLSLPGEIRLTLTQDNGKENTYHRKVANTLNMDVFFCHAYHSWEKGTVENTNQRIRRYIPKGVSIDAFSEEYIKEVEHSLNSTPRKCLGYLTPYEKLNQALT